MGQKVNPRGIRLGIVTDCMSKWYALSKDFADTLGADLKARRFLQKKLGHAGISRIQIDRPPRSASITISVARPGMLMKELDKISAEVSKIFNVPVHIALEEVRKPELDAKLVGESIAQQLERRVMFRRAMKRAVTSAMRAGAQGIKISVSGRLGGSEIARTEWYREGRVPLHTFRADIDYALSEAFTTYGVIGIKVWIFKGEVLGDKATQAEVSEKTEK
ncbi:MAG TPA: 30S ribosomal protein S3 [Gammaproteobacteria bacterium]|jgi:small subunit ribosomal protein S3|nr:30S ribosomal protein S3 [Gammaproteobacteria bacterium]